MQFNYFLTFVAIAVAGVAASPAAHPPPPPKPTPPPPPPVTQQTVSPLQTLVPA